MPGKSNTQQSKPQQGGLNMHANRLAIQPAPYSFIMWAHVASIGGQSALIA